MHQRVRSSVYARLLRRNALDSFRFVLPGRKRTPLPPQHARFRDTLNPNVSPPQAYSAEPSASHPPSAPRFREKSQATPTGVPNMCTRSRLSLIAIDRRLSKNYAMFHSGSTIECQGR